MLVFRILATVFVALSMFTSIFKNYRTFRDYVYVGISVYSVLWRAFVIVAIWLV